MEKITLVTHEIRRLIKPMKMVVNHSPVLPILEDALFQIKDKKLVITVTDLETTLSTDISISYEGVAFSFTVAFSKLYSFVMNCESENFSMEFIGKKQKVVITSIEPEVTISLPTESSDNYPKSPALKTRTLVINRKAGDIVPWIKNALPFVSNDDLRPSMTGVCFMKHEGKVVVVATDAHRLYRRSLFDHALEMGLENNVIVPRKPSRVMCELFKKPEDMLLILADDTHLSVVNDDYFIITRLVDARYPDWTKVWPEENPYSFFAKRKQLKAMITLALPYSNMSTRQLVLEVAENSLIGATQDVDWQFDFSYKMPIYNTNIDPAVNEIAFNGNLLMQAITVTKDDLVKIEFSSSTKATIIDNDILLMPLLLNK